MFIPLTDILNFNTFPSYKEGVFFDSRRSIGLSGLSGLAAAISNQQIGGASGAVAGTAVGLIIGGPVGALAGAAIGAVGSLIGGIFTPDYTKIDSSDFANSIQSQMIANLNSWKALPQSKKCASIQAYYIQNYQGLWNQLVNYCSNPSLGTAGQHCISDRDVNSPTVKWPWATVYETPIATDSTVLPDSQCPAIQDLIANGTYLTQGSLTAQAVVNTPNSLITAPVSSSVNSAASSIQPTVASSAQTQTLNQILLNATSLEGLFVPALILVVALTLL